MIHQDEITFNRSPEENMVSRPAERRETTHIMTLNDRVSVRNERVFEGGRAAPTDTRMGIFGFK